ncbi:MAG: 16S rRNA (cytidine(1402)-2'-O)-methyltransferase [Deltaproteobacteria bacterium]|nr:16S rRNA (cytidine(1402)-2'-O)-methyltransferase [Deltaproteobacteria bacterium]
MPGSLFVVATPIGNLDDLSPRARETLASVSLIACEDTRVTQKLLARFELAVPLVAFHAHSNAETLARLVQKLDEGSDVALVSDAGAPLVSDPGRELVEAAILRGIPVIPIPGPSAVTTAVMASGVEASRFVFLGFLPRDPTEQRAFLTPFESLPAALVIFESKERLAATLAILAAALGDRPACVARELTKRFESFERGHLRDLGEKFEREETKGEITIVVGPPTKVAEVTDRDAARNELRRLLDRGVAPSEAARTIAGAFHLPKREVYKMALELGRSA